MDSCELETRVTTWPARLSFNQFTATPKSLHEWLPEAARLGVPGIGLNREQVEAYGVDAALAMVRDAAIPVTIYSSVGFWASGFDPEGRLRGFEENIRNLDEAVAAGTDLVGVISGGLAPDSKDLAGARSRVAEGLRELIPYATERGLKLGVEPLHPIFGPTRSVIHTLRQTLDLIEMVGAPENLGVVVDTYHVWWEPNLVAQLQRAGERVFLVQVNDWSPSIAREGNPYRDRALPGEGCIDYEAFRRGLEGYEGWVEIEAPNPYLRALSPSDMLLDLANLCERVFGDLLVPAGKATTSN
jgi:sugar phosphate isomerase/epimerase